MAPVLVSLGSNRGDRRGAMERALAGLAASPLVCNLRASSLHETAPIGGPAGQGAFLNAAAAFESDAQPVALLELLQTLELAEGRDRGPRWGERTLDLDLLAVGTLVLRTQALTLPHPRVSFRPFVLGPLVEVAPLWRHPELGATAGELLGAITLGRDTLAVDGGDDAESALAFAQLLRAAGWAAPLEAGGRAFLLAEATRAGPTRLTIETSPGHGPLPPGPRLRLADCPPEHWASEVAAAVRCVWTARPPLGSPHGSSLGAPGGAGIS